MLLGQAYGTRANLERGDALELVGPAGRRTAPVVGIIDAIGPMTGMEMRLSLDTMAGTREAAEKIAAQRIAKGRL